ncbi:MAG: SCP2 sterol-binding domain-containing protein [Deltaproteobacteria bacterium]|jgi:putative sterol carrier protein|nr:SCP2 sterol-binding domain-containing protein [Deltaproteobacteria bacterium]
MTIEELFAKIRTKADQISLDERPPVSILLNILSLETEKYWLVRLANGQATLDEVQTGSLFEPDVMVSLSEETLLSLASRELSPLKAFLLGRVKIKGDSGLLSQLKYLWPES